MQPALTAAGSCSASAWCNLWPGLLIRQSDKVITFLSPHLKFYTISFHYSYSYIPVSGNELNTVYELFMAGWHVSTFYGYFVELLWVNGKNYFLFFTKVLHLQHRLVSLIYIQPLKSPNGSRSPLWLRPVQIKPQWSELGTDVHSVRGSGPPAETQPVL